jgi:hypothetical protein
MLDTLYKLIGAALVVLAVSLSVMAQEEPAVVNSSEYVGSLVDLRDKKRALLVVFKSRVIDVNNPERAIIDDVLKAHPLPKGRYRWVYTGLAGKLNKYIRKYRSLWAARDLADADYVIFFNVVEFRRILNTIYPYGELFVIIKGSPQDLRPPRVVWRAKKVQFAGDAIGDLIKDLKVMRGEG